MLKKMFSTGGFWHIIYLVLFYVSTTMTLIFVYLVAQSRRWISIQGDLLQRSLFNGQSSFSKAFFLFLAVFFIVNTLYLIRRKE